MEKERKKQNMQICELKLYFEDTITRKAFSMCLSGLPQEN